MHCRHQSREDLGIVDGERQDDNRMWWCLPWLVICGLLISGCLNRPAIKGVSHSRVTASPPEPTLCTAIRGNGNLIFAHFGAIARILEDIGEIDGMAGGSSGSISAFFYESMLLNPALPPRAGGAPLHGEERSDHENRGTGRETRRDILALLMKSLMGFAVAVGESPEGHALKTLTGIGNKVRDQGLLSLVRVNWWNAGQKLHRIVSDPEVRELMNPTALHMLISRDHIGVREYRFRIEELIRSASVLGGFEPTDPSMFFREPIVSYEGFTRVLGRIANFYAGVDSVSNAVLLDFIQSCLSMSRGRTWSQIASLPLAQGTCGSLFAQAVNTYRMRVRTGVWTPPIDQDRVHQTIGQFLITYVPTAILDGVSAVDTFAQSLATYRSEKKASLPVDFDDVRFGYFTPYPQGHGALFAMKDRFSNNAKVAKAVHLNSHAKATWQEALRYSTIEPGLSRIIQAGSDRAYIGGWADLHPTQILRASGCKKIVYINRIGPETTFVAKQRPNELGAPTGRHGVAEWLNMTSEQYWHLYDMKNPDNAYNQSIREADAVWCTDRDSALPTDWTYLFDHAYGSIPSARGPNAGHVSGMAIRSAVDRPYFLHDGIPHIDTPLWGCHIR